MLPSAGLSPYSWSAILLEKYTSNQENRPLQGIQETFNFYLSHLKNESHYTNDILVAGADYTVLRAHSDTYAL